MKTSPKEQNEIYTALYRFAWGYQTLCCSWNWLLDYAPHDWLFPKVSAVVHHGGVGTLAAGLYAGRPTLIVPFLVDQPHWGHFIEEELLGPPPLSPFSFSEEAFEDRINQLLTNPKYRDHSKIIKDNLCNEQEGVEATVKTIIEALTNQNISTI